MGCAVSAVICNTSDSSDNIGCELIGVQPPPLETREISVQNIADKDAIAIVGIACKTPGAENIRDFWRIILNGENHITDVPATRWNAEAFYDKDPTKQGKTHVRKAGFVTSIEEFDNAFFGINDFEIASMDPQQRFVLECTHMALEDGGLTRAGVSGSNTGVFIGAMNADHSFLYNAGTQVDMYGVTGVTNAILAARVSYAYNLLGPSMVIDTACSSALVCIHAGAQAIRNGECDMAICGGVNYVANPAMFVQLSKSAMISGEGQSKAFSADADGYARAEGCGIVILKRLRDAIKDNDNIWATVVSGTNQDGRMVTPMTSPSGKQQVELMRQIYQKFSVDASSVDYIEAHAAGTQAGDPVEVNAVGTFFKEAALPRTRYIGSVKTNVGHLESASGAIGVIKVLLMMKFNTIVPSLFCREVNPRINLDELRLMIPQKPVAWDKTEKMACVNSFGFGGTNCHVVLQTVPRVEKIPTSRRDLGIVCFSGKTKLSLRRSMEMMSQTETVSMNSLSESVSDAEERLRAICYTSTVRRDHHPFRKAFLADDFQTLCDDVSQCLAGGLVVKAKTDPHIVFVFCGMGTAWAGMCQQMMNEFLVFKKTIQEIDAVLSKISSHCSLIESLEKEDCSNDPLMSPIAIFACQVALLAVWKSLGVTPSCVVGQSVGEVAAAFAAGCISLESAVTIIYFRSLILTEVTGGKMVVVKNVSLQNVRAALKDFPNASISLEYSPVSCAVSADADTMMKLRQRLNSLAAADGRPPQVISLDVPVAYHSKFVDSCIPQLAKALGNLQASPPKLQYISAVSGDELTSAPDQSYWTSHIRQPVLFHKAVRGTRKTNPNKTVFLEIGPKPVLKAHIQDIFPGEDLPVVTSMSRQPEKKVFLQAVVSLYELGTDMEWQAMYDGSYQVTDVPRYVFDKKTSLKRTETQATFLSGTSFVNPHLFLYPINVKSKDLFKIVLSAFTSDFVYDHVVGHTCIVPGALYLEAGFAIARYTDNNVCHQQPIVSARFVSPVSSEKNELIELDLQRVENASTLLTSTLQLDIRKNDRLVAVLKIDHTPAVRLAPETINLQHIKAKCAELVEKNAIYSALRSLNFHFGESFSLLDHGFRGERECLACIKPTPKVCRDFITTTIHPSVLDAMLQSSVILMSSRDKKGQQLLPESISGVKVFDRMELCMFVHCRIEKENPRSTSYSCVLYAADGRTLASLEEFVVSEMSIQADNNLPMLMSVKWEPAFDSWNQRASTKVGTSILLVNSGLDVSDDKVITLIPNSRGAMEWSEIEKEASTVMQRLTTSSAYVILCHSEITAGTTSEELETSVMNKCGMIQSILKFAVDKKLTSPIYVCTTGAWPAPEGEPQLVAVNPASTALWGLVRTVQAEKIYENITLIDLHIPPKRLSSNYFSSMAEYLSSPVELNENREYLITENKVFVNRISRLGRDTSVPEYREVFLDVNSDSVVLSQDPNEVSSPVAVKVVTPLEVTNSDILIKPHLFSLPSPVLLKMDMTLRQSAIGANKYAVFALETLGHSTGQSQELVVTCCPVHAGTCVTVPKETVIEASAIPDYQPGDLTKLVLLSALCAKVRTSGVTILASSTNKSFAEVLKIILKSNDTTRSVDIMTSEELHLKKVMSETLVSLILLDSVVMESLSTQWEIAKYLVTCKGLLTISAHSHFLYAFQHVEIKTVDSQQLFQPLILTRMVPEIKIWMKEQTNQNASEMAKHLHPSRKTAADLSSDTFSSLLEFKTFTLDGLTLRARTANLFDRNSLYIVVAGLTGLGWICVKYLAEQGAGHIAILQRRQPTNEHVSNMKTVSQTCHCNIHVCQADVTKLDETQDALQSLMQRFPKVALKGIFFGAAVIEDGHFFSMTREKFVRALSPKLMGAWNLHVLTKNLHLDFFVLHSSVTSLLGNQGQTNYSAGNAFLDGLAYFRRSLGLTAQSFGWGPLDTGLLSDKENVKQKLESFGYFLMTEQEIKHGLPALLMLNWPHCSPVKLNEKQFAQQLANKDDRSLLARLQLSVTLKDRKKMDDTIVDVHTAKTMDPASRQEVYVLYVTSLTCRILSISDRSLVTPDTNLVNLGFDSVSVRMMIDQIHRDTDVELKTLTFASGEATVRTLANILNEQIALS